MKLTSSEKALIHIALTMLAKDVRDGNSLQVNTSVDSINNLIFKVIRSK